MHVIAGAAPKPAAALVAMHHGDELFSVEVLRAVDRELRRSRPVGDIGVFNGASENAAVRFSVFPKSAAAAAAEISVQATMMFPEVTIAIKKGSETLKSIKPASLAPEKPLTLTVEFACSAADLAARLTS